MSLEKKLEKRKAKEQVRSMNCGQRPDPVLALWNTKLSRGGVRERELDVAFPGIATPLMCSH